MVERERAIPLHFLKGASAFPFPSSTLFANNMMGFIAGRPNSTSTSSRQRSFGDELVTSSDIIAFHRCTVMVGKRIRSSKSKTTWALEVKFKAFTIELLVSKLSRKRIVRVNGELQKDKNSKNLSFIYRGLDFKIGTGSDGVPNLSINSHSFEDLKNGRSSEVEGVLSRQKVEFENQRSQSESDIKFDAKVSIARQSSARRSSRMLRRSDASVKDITNVKSIIKLGSKRSYSETDMKFDAPKHSITRPSTVRRSSRMLRRSDASVQDFTALKEWKEWSRSSAREFRRSDATVPDIEYFESDSHENCSFSASCKSRGAPELQSNLCENTSRPSLSGKKHSTSLFKFAEAGTLPSEMFSAGANNHQTKLHPVCSHKMFVPVNASRP